MIIGNLSNKLQIRSISNLLSLLGNIEETVDELEVNFPWIHCIVLHKQYIICGCDDGAIRIFIRKTLKEVLSLKGHEDGVNHLTIADNMIYSSSFDNSIKSWDIEEIEIRLEEMALMFQEDILSRKVFMFSAGKKKKGKKKRGKKKKKKAKSGEEAKSNKNKKKKKK